MFLITMWTLAGITTLSALVAVVYAVKTYKEVKFNKKRG